jgi:hypothetical protein
VSDATEMTAGAGEATEVATEVDAVLAGLGQARKVGRYTLLELLGTGGMGVVFTAYDEELDRKVAIKFLQRSSADPQALLREAQAQARLAHPNVIHVYEVGVAEARVFLAMEFVRGQSLRAWSQVDRSWAEVVGIFVQAGRGLAAAHAAGVVHCDFKPETWSPPRTAPLPPSGRILANWGDLRGGRRRWGARRAAVLATAWQRAGRYCSRSWRPHDDAAPGPPPSFMVAHHHCGPRTAPSGVALQAHRPGRRRQTARCERLRASAARRSRLKMPPA